MTTGSLIVGLFFSAICGMIAAYVILRFLYKRQLKKMNDPKYILDNLKKANKDYYVEGQKIDLVGEIERQLTPGYQPQQQPKEDLTQYMPPQPKPLPQSPKPLDKNSLNKMLGKKR